MTNEQIVSNNNGLPVLIEEVELKLQINATISNIKMQHEQEQIQLKQDKINILHELLTEERNQNQMQQEEEVLEFTISDTNGYLKELTDSDIEEDREGESKSNSIHMQNKKLSMLIRNSDEATMTLWTSSLNINQLTTSAEDEEQEEQEDIGTRAILFNTLSTPSSFLWMVLSVSSGRFAGCIFNNGVLIDSKTFYRYTTRAGQGGSQSSADSGGGSNAKSAGATLRRYNELALHQEIQTLLMEEWSDYIEESNKIFVSGSSSALKLLYKDAKGGKKKLNPGAITKTNPKVHKISFQTNRPTIEECKRICRCCATCWVTPLRYGNENQSDSEESEEEEEERVLQAPMIRRHIPSYEILPMETKKRKKVVGKVLEDGYGEVMVWELKEEVVVGCGWRNVIEEVEEEEGGSWLY